MMMLSLKNMHFFFFANNLPDGTLIPIFSSLQNVTLCCCAECTRVAGDYGTFASLLWTVDLAVGLEYRQ
jgi:hypothetical protein